jgi:hypothetical protein
MDGIHEVTGSTPVSSNLRFPRLISPKLRKLRLAGHFLNGSDGKCRLPFVALLLFEELAVKSEEWAGFEI